MSLSKEEFLKLSDEERILRGTLSTKIRMISKRKSKISKLKEEIKKLEMEKDELKERINDLGVDFPTFDVQRYDVKGIEYMRGVWYRNGKKEQKHLGSSELIESQMNSLYDDYSGLLKSKRDMRIKEHFLPTLKVLYWEKEYMNHKGGNV